MRGKIGRISKSRNSRSTLIFATIVVLLVVITIFSDGIQIRAKAAIAAGTKIFAQGDSKAGGEFNYIKHWSFNYLPTGYEITNWEAHGSFVIVNILNKEGNEILFYYQLGDHLADLSYNNQIQKVDKCEIMDTEAYCINAIKGSVANNGLAWNIYGYTFELWAKLPVNELKLIAESLSENLQ